MLEINRYRIKQNDILSMSLIHIVLVITEKIFQRIIKIEIATNNNSIRYSQDDHFQIYSLRLAFH